MAHFSKHADELDSMTVSPEEVGDQAVHLLSVVDQDRSKTVSFEEFVKCVVPAGRPAPPSPARTNSHHSPPQCVRRGAQPNEGIHQPGVD